MIYKDSIDFLIDLYDNYLIDQKLPKMCAYELLLDKDITLTHSQHEWVSNFSNLWEKVQNAE